MLIGRVTKDEGSQLWAVEISAVGGHTQGRSRKEAFEMAADLVKEMVKDKFDRPRFKATAADYPAAGDDAILIETNDPAVVAAYVLWFQRTTHGLSLADVRKRLGSSSRTIYYRCERGTSVPTIGRYYELLAAVAPEMTLVFGDRGEAVKRKSHR